MRKTIVLHDPDPETLAVLESFLHDAGVLFSLAEPAGDEVPMVQLASGLVHELRNPLSAVVMAGKILRRSLGDAAAEPAQLADAILKESTRLNEILEDFLKYARPVPPRRTPQDLAALLDESLAALQTRLDTSGACPRWEIHRSLTPVPELAVDRDQMQELFDKLLCSAVDAMPSGGVLQAGCEPEAGGVCVRISHGGDFSGNASAAFLPFASETRDGLSLRLPVCRRLAAGHGGTLQASPRAGGGTTFTLRLPCAAQDAAGTAH
jgi:signal transduction histidine kinase